MRKLQANERLIVALDVPTAAEAADLVGRLEPEVSFFKVGWQLYVTGELTELFARLAGKNVFLDLKLPGDIGRTIGAVVEFCVKRRVRFLTLSDFVPAAAVAAARGTRGASEHPLFLTVPYLSSLDAGDLAGGSDPAALEAHILKRAAAALDAGCDGLIASGDAIAALRAAHPGVVIVSPGIRPAGSSSDDHKRSTTPAEALRKGADYLVVGRPICQASDPRAAARRILDEMRAASA